VNHNPIELYARSTLFWIGLIIVTIFYFCIMLFIAVLPLPLRRKIIMTWADVMLYWLEKTCGIHYTVTGQENIPKEPCIIVSNHESAWETIAFQIIFPKHLWVLKRELLWIPLFGWTLKMIGPIAINRSDRSAAMQQILKQGRACLDEGLWLLVFPQGTRLPPNDPTPYKLGAARMSSGFNVPLLPVAMNAGDFWPRNSFVKKPGTVSVIIGPPIFPEGRSPEIITEEVETWIRTHRPNQ
jgi:1-acyl-sn-glycerol-3-phosphate acyltransferase